MKNVKLTLATTLLALTFAGTASADGGNYRDYRFNNHKQKNVIAKTTTGKSKFTKNTKNTKNTNRHFDKNTHRNKRVVKRVVVKNTPTRKVVITKTIIEKPAKSWYAKNKRFQHVKRFNKQYRQYQKHANYNQRFNAKRVVRPAFYSVRPGDTLIQISYKTGVSIPRLARLNRIRHGHLNHLRIGQKLRLA